MIGIVGHRLSIDRLPCQLVSFFLTVVNSFNFVTNQVSTFCSICQWYSCLVVGGRVSPFRLKIFFAYKRNKANSDPFHMCFTISL
jgi:hypothetical protein